MSVPIKNNTVNLTEILEMVDKIPGTQKTTGTFRIDSDNQISLNCGFQPDLLILQLGTYYSDDDQYLYEVNYGIPLGESEREVNICGYPGDEYDFEFIDIFAWYEGGNIGLWIGGYYSDWSDADITNINFKYIAIEYP